MPVFWLYGQNIIFNLIRAPSENLLINSILKYLNSHAFNPEMEINIEKNKRSDNKLKFMVEERNIFIPFIVSIIRIKNFN
jgi:hypothetical protein